MPPVIGKVEAGSVAQKAGLTEGDSIISIDGKEIISWYAVSETIAQNEGEEIEIAVVRQSQTVVTEIIPQFNEEYNRRMVGIVLASPAMTLKSYKFYVSAKLAFEDCVKYSKMIVNTLKRLVQRAISPKYLSGPVGIMQMSGAAAQSGLPDLLRLLALIGINLGLINLMPLVVTDGGVLSLLFVEAVTGKPIPEKVRNKLSIVFMALFLCLAAYVTVNDIVRFEDVNRVLGIER